MTSKRAKGSAFERWVEAWLIKNDPSCKVHRQVSLSKYIPSKGIFVSTRNDILGCIDLICVSPSMGVTFIQATMHTGTGKKMNDLRQVPWPYDKVNVQLWQKKCPRRVVIWSLKESREYLIGEIQNGKWVEKEGP
jgi:hypothetical protein